jgi:hypothetical protein
MAKELIYEPGDEQLLCISPHFYIGLLLQRRQPVIKWGSHFLTAEFLLQKGFVDSYSMLTPLRLRLLWLLKKGMGPRKIISPHQ